MKTKKIVSVAVIVLCLAAAAFILCKRFLPSDRETPENVPSQPPVQESAAPQADSELPEPAFEDSGTVLINEFMAKNRSALSCTDGCFYDWIELVNSSDRSVSLNGWSVSDSAKGGWALPDMTLDAGQTVVIYASGLDCVTDSELHADFSLSGGETIVLKNPRGEQEDAAFIAESSTDVSYVRSADGAFSACLYPTPGQENTAEGYCLVQEKREQTGPLVINEVVTKNYADTFGTRTAYPDWVEVKNISSSPVSLSEYYLSDDLNALNKAPLPELTLDAGEIAVILCTEDERELSLLSDSICVSLSLDSERESIYLSTANGIADYIYVKDLPYGGSFGRLDGQNGDFIFTSPTPGANNTDGYRYYCPRPTADAADGVYNDIDSLTVNISGEGTVYYTTDGSLPTASSPVYTGPITLTETTVIRAVCSDGVGLDSRPATFSYFINEGHTLPVISVVGDDPAALAQMYRQGNKGPEYAGCIEFFEDDGSFSIDCGIRMAGRATLGQAKKNLTFKFRGAYGQSKLKYDIFGSGMTEFSSLTLRAGQDCEKAVIRDDISAALALQFTDKALAQHSRFCVMYMNGEYYGVFSLKEKVNEDFCADYAGVSKESIEMYEAPFVETEEFYRTVFQPCNIKDMSVDENYRAVCQYLDIDSFIDFMIVQGYTANHDILYGNVGFYRSPESDGKWKALLYDFDAAFRVDYYNFRNIYNIDYMLCQVAQIHMNLMKNPEYREKFLTRASEALAGPMSNENVTALMQELFTSIDKEMERDCVRWKLDYRNYERCRDEMLKMITVSDFHAHSIETIALMAKLTPEEIEEWFGA